MTPRLIWAILFILVALAGMKFMEGFGKQPPVVIVQEQPRAILTFLCGGVGVNVRQQFQDPTSRPGAQCWEGLRFMDRHLAEGRISEALAIRHRAEDLVRLHATVMGLKPEQMEEIGPASMMSQHADIVTADGAPPILDPDPSRARRRMISTEILAAFWEGRVEEGMALSASLPSLPLESLQVVEIMAGLRMRAVAVSMGADGDDLNSAMEWFEWTRSVPSPLVQGERAHLGSALLLADRIPEDKTEICCQDSLAGARSALLADSPRTDELLRIVFEMLPWSEAPEAWTREAVRVTRALGVTIRPELFSAAYERYLAIDPSSSAEWVEEILASMATGELRARAMRAKAVTMAKGQADPATVFACFDEALKATPSTFPKARADLLVDLAIYEKDLDLSTPDPNRGYLRRSAERLKEAVSLVDDHDSARLNLAIIALRGQKNDAAKVWLEKTRPQRLGRGSRAVWHWVQGQIAVSEGRVDEAKAHASSARQLEPGLKGLSLLEMAIKEQGG
ncbi:MAG: tetratricopeptide repeat protein [Planctomycetota bacterium]